MGTGHATRRRGADADATAHDDRQRRDALQLLQQDEAGVFTHPAAGLVAERDQAIDRVTQCGGGVGAGDFGPHREPGVGGAQLGDAALLHRSGFGCEKDGEAALLCLRQQFQRLRQLGRADAQADAGFGVPGEIAKMQARAVGRAGMNQVEDPGGATARQRQRQLRREIARVETEDLEGALGLGRGGRGRHGEYLNQSKSALHAFQKRHFHHFLVNDGAVTEVAVLAEALAVVGGDDEMGVGG